MAEHENILKPKGGVRQVMAFEAHYICGHNQLFTVKSTADAQRAALELASTRPCAACANREAERAADTTG